MQNKNLEEKGKQMYQELANKEEQLSSFKKEIQNIQEKYRQKTEEVFQN